MSKKTVSLKSGAVISMENASLPVTMAGKIALITKLLGDEPIYSYDEYGNILEEIGRTPQLITKEQALELLNIKPVQCEEDQ